LGNIGFEALQATRGPWSVCRIIVSLRTAGAARRCRRRVCGWVGELEGGATGAFRDRGADPVVVWVRVCACFVRAML
jgi:hypothetical protein